jgi:serine protease Do
MLYNQAFSSTPPDSFADMVEKLTPTVVNISTTQKIKGIAPGMQMFEMPNNNDISPEFKDFFEQFLGQNGRPVEREGASLGSGFIIDADGLVVTNNHVIANADEITVILSDDSKFKAKIIGRDVKTDLALLKIDAGKKLPFAVLGDSDSARVGDWVVAIGNPFGLGGTVTAGIISARSRNINSGPFDDFIQTDAAINRGNSGGPMFNIKGEVIGINTAIFSPTGASVGIGFAVPTALANPVITQLKTSGRIERGWLGIKIRTVTEEFADSVGLKKASGAFIESVSKDSPASKAGIIKGDIITKFDGKEIKEMRNLPRVVAETKIGKTVTVEVWRKNAFKELSITVGELKEAEKADNSTGNESKEKLSNGKTNDILGLSIAAINPALASRYNIPEDVIGAVIIEVKQNSEAEKRKIKSGDLIIQVGDIVTKTPQDVINAVAELRKQGRKFALIQIARQKEEATFIPLPIE